MNIRCYILCLSLLLIPCLPSLAGDSIRLRNCRPQLEKHAAKIPHRTLPMRESGINKMIGERRQLVVLVSFSDQNFKEFLLRATRL